MLILVVNHSTPGTVTLLVEVLRNKSEGRGYDSRCCQWCRLSL